MEAKAPRGVSDVLPGEVERWQRVEAVVQGVFARYGYRELRLPIFEHTELFQRGIGDSTDIVEKEMYTFTDKGGRSVTLRPEGTASVVRAFLEHKLYGGVLPFKAYYVGPMFRYERPQAGRYRQFHQFGAEALGSLDPALDVEMIAMPIAIYRELGLEQFLVKVNSIGCPNCRPRYRDRLKAALSDRTDQLCGDCVRRLERNPLRILDCKVPGCIQATADVPSIEADLCEECTGHFAQVRSLLDELGLPYIVDPRLVRGFDYYTKTVFEVISTDLGAQNALCGGGRYDGLIAEVGGRNLPAVGFAAGVERLLMVLAEKGIDVAPARALDAYVVTVGEEARRAALTTVFRLRNAGLAVETDYTARSLKAQMKEADRLGARVALLFGKDEADRGAATGRVMATGEQCEIPLDGLVEWVGAHTKSSAQR